MIVLRDRAVAIERPTVDPLLRSRPRFRLARTLVAVVCVALVSRVAAAQGADSVLARARAAASRGDRAAAATLYGEAIALDSSSVPALREFVALLESDGHWQRAFPAARRLAVLVPVDSALELKLGDWWSWSGRPDSGSTHLRRALAAEPASARVQGALGQVLSWNGATRLEGIALLRRAADAAPPDPSASRALAAALSWNAATRGEALGRYAALVAKTPDDASLLADYGEVLSWDPRRGREANAALTGARSRALRSGDSATAVRAAHAAINLFTWSNRPKRALALADTLLRTAPTDSAALHGRASALLALGRAREALPLFRSLSAAAPSDVGVAEALAYALAAAGHPAEARSVAARLPTTASPNARDWVRRGTAPAVGLDVTASRNSYGLAITRFTASASALIGLRTRASAFARPAHFSTPADGFDSQMFGVAFDAPVALRTTVHAEGAVDRYGGVSDNWSGAVDLSRTLDRDGDVRVSLRRSAIEDSRRAARGVDVGGVFVGQVRSNLAAVSVRTPTLPGQLHVALSGDVGPYVGESLRTNVRREGAIALERDIAPGAQLLRVGIGLNYLGYTYDANRGNAPLDEQGGYWSPRALGSTFVRAQLTIHATGRLTLQSGGSINYLTSGEMASTQHTSVAFSANGSWVGTHGWDITAGGFYIDNLTGFRLRQLGVGVQHAF